METIDPTVTISPSGSVSEPQTKSGQGSSHCRSEVCADPWSVRAAETRLVAGYLATLCGIRSLRFTGEEERSVLLTVEVTPEEEKGVDGARQRPRTGSNGGLTDESTVS